MNRSDFYPQAQQAQVTAATTAAPPPRPLYWSLRRELWENRSVYLAPLGATALSLLGFLVSLFYPFHGHAGAAHTPAEQQILFAMPYAHVEWLITIASVLVGFFYSLDALYGERRDRSILFWKSMPVSDATTVLAKALVPLCLLPLLTAVLSIVLQWIMLPLGTAEIALHRGDASGYWTSLPLLQMQVVTVYSIVTMTLWQAPIYGWLLLISVWARRTPFLWAVLPPLAIAAFEEIALHTHGLFSFLGARFAGYAERAFNFTLPDGSKVAPHYIPITQVTLGHYLSSPSLWLGLLFTAACLFTAVRLRHTREPI